MPRSGIGMKEGVEEEGFDIVAERFGVKEEFTQEAEVLTE